MTASRMSQRKRRGRGQALTEFALVAPVFFLLMFSVIEFGILFGGQNGLVATAREMARYTAPYRVKTVVDANNVCADTRLGQQLTNFLSSRIPGYSANNAGQRQLIYTWRLNPDNTYFVQLTVNLSYHFPLHVPLVGNIIDGLDSASDNKFLLTASEQMRIENEDLTFTTAPGGPVSCTI